jgi:restriction system protein
MTQLNLQELIRKIDDLEQEAVAQEAELKLLGVLTPLLESEGYMVEHTGGPGDIGIDFLAKKTENAETDLPAVMGIQYKHYSSLVGANVIQQIIGVSLLNNLDRMILLSKSGFSKQAWEIAKRDLPTAIELVDLTTLRAWVARVERSLRSDYSQIIKAITDLSKHLAKIIANKPSELANMEWRDIERMLASIFEGLGFDVELTPPSKDGGKDIILEFSVSGVNQSYLVEVKHWRSKQKVGHGYISHFVDVVANEKRQGGLYLATYGYSHDAFEALTEIERSRIFAGNEEKVISLCRTFVKAESGLWSAPAVLTDVIVENTIPVNS